ncbi:MAG TPA: DsrH/TusB family sulfur metabolism protein [Mesotoga infera]|uniref:Sulfur relay protein TusB/DsrH n=1 Tax=Mesotoga infera TaxID=1236046 RepID=A0A7Z7PQG3_9BACT|nr:DsrH/TusB family sulfur metabolism protein [Mesotoga infera]MBP8659800.1 sulfur relay protein DsrH [Mesotoga sp.]SSC14112.1 Sulfur relay protein TusB/DsrH [Mesotoga infera]HNR79653.1 DsrH/TusB family sulfur metabolism protein [Mesotoga infera]HON26948.1 DsrH/TusB family sulfur metabolism protein [Mesotoga infera]
MALIVIKYGKQNVAESLKFMATRKGDSVVLVQDGIFWALDELNTEAEVFAIIDDVKARGYSADDLTVPSITYDEFVEIIEKSEKTIG